jgi:excisionase family DNA binding protein
MTPADSRTLTTKEDNLDHAVLQSSLADEARNDREPRLWTVADVARYLGCSRSWVYRETGAGRLPGLRIGGRVRFDPEALFTWAKSREVR